MITVDREKMKVYTWTDYEGVYAISSVEFKLQNLCEAYDYSGVKYGCERAGCKSFDNPNYTSMFLKEFDESFIGKKKDKSKCCFEYYKERIQRMERNNLGHAQARYETFKYRDKNYSIIIKPSYGDVKNYIEEVDPKLKEDILSDLENAKLNEFHNPVRIFKGKKYRFKDFFNDSPYEWAKYIVMPISKKELQIMSGRNYAYYKDENYRYILVKLFYEEMDHSQDIPAITEEMKQSIFQELIDTQQIVGFHAASSVDSKLIQIQHNYDYENWELFKFPKK